MARAALIPRPSPDIAPSVILFRQRSGSARNTSAKRSPTAAPWPGIGHSTIPGKWAMPGSSRPGASPSCGPAAPYRRAISVARAFQPAGSRNFPVPGSTGRPELGTGKSPKPAGWKARATSDNSQMRPSRPATGFLEAGIYFPKSRTKSIQRVTSGTELSQLYSYSTEILPWKPCFLSSSRVLLISPTPCP